MQALQVKRWNDLVRHIEKWFYRPDLEALRIALSVAVTHSFPGKGETPIWLFVVGPAGGGKTKLYIESLAALPQTTVISKITEKAFVSGFRPGGKKPKGKNADGTNKSYSFLERIGKSQILLWKDFTTLLDERPESLKVIMGQLREIWDGRLTNNTGSVTEEICWEGKITIIAACTPELERRWGVHRSLGERFMQVHLKGLELDEQVDLQEMALQQTGNVAEINDGIKARVGEFVAGVGVLPKMKMPKELLYLGQIVAQLRVNVSWQGMRITDVGTPETPTRISVAMGKIAQAHAALFRREVGEEDLKLARRVGLDSVPSKRRILMDLIVAGGDEVSTAELAETSGLHRNIVSATMEELEALGAVIRTADNAADDPLGIWWRITDGHKELRKKAGL